MQDTSSQRSFTFPEMQPYRNVATNQFLPIYWNCEQCSCKPACLQSGNPESNSCSVPVDAQRPSFTIESLLSRKDERKPDLLKQCRANSSFKVALVSSGTPGQFSNDSSELIPTHGSGYLAQFQRPPSFASQISLFGRGNIQANGEFIYAG